jgi:hypothetical protein
MNNRKRPTGIRFRLLALLPIVDRFGVRPVGLSSVDSLSLSGFHASIDSSSGDDCFCSDDLRGKELAPASCSTSQHVSQALEDVVVEQRPADARHCAGAPRPAALSRSPDGACVALAQLPEHFFGPVAHDLDELEAKSMAPMLVEVDRVEEDHEQHADGTTS